MAMLMPTLIPVVMPPAPVARDAAGASGNLAGAASNSPASPSSRASQDATPLPSALTTDAARLLAMQGADVAVPAGATDAGAWQGLQRWSADLMTAMTPGAMSGGTDVGASVSSTLTLPASREAWQQPLMQALGDRLQLQIAQRADSARLHLEPPQLGRIEIDIRQQGGALQVQLSASNDDVRQQLRQIAEPLRHELVQRHSGDVSVQVASGAQAAGDGRGRDGAAAGGQPQSGGQQRDAQRQPGRALQDDDHGTSGASAAFGFADALAGNAAGAVGVGAMGFTGGITVGNTRTTR
ncbi:flagellar hook-length control protein FliK [Roseateles sp. UC29_93]|uniref:flagellar hook-length control protein FliK n=1 Tax=Roseateles sp. UC29_93 TaxID=3350177 RepID=UPI00366E04F4